MAVNLKGMSRKELEKLRSDIDKAIEKIEVEDKKAAMAAAEKAAKAHGFSLSELTSDGKGKTRRKSGKASGPKGAPKYANPADKSQTWTGRGRQPAWIKEGLSSGKSLEDFAI